MHSPRIHALEQMWYEFAKEHNQEIKEMLPIVSPWAAINYWGARYADYILNKDPVLIEMATEAHARQSQMANETKRG